MNILLIIAQATPAVTTDNLVAWLTPIIVPLVLALVKKYLPRLPSSIIPLLAPVLGLVIGIVDNLFAAHSSNLWLAAGLGLLGVAVREVKESLKPAVNGGWPVTNPPTP